MFEKFGHDFYINFIKDDRYTWLLDGLKNTMIITVFALLMVSVSVFWWQLSVLPTINPGILKLPTPSAEFI